MSPGHGSTFQQLLHWRNVSMRHPYALPSTPLTRRHVKCQLSQRCTLHSHHHPINHLMSAPGAMGWYGTDRGGQGAPSTSKFSSKTSRITLALPESASALPGDIAGDRARFCAGSRSRPPPGSLMRLSGEFQVAVWATSGRNVGVACLFWARSVRNCIVCNVDT